MELDLLRELTEASGVPGYEDRIRAIVRRELSDSTDRVATDAMGNVVGTLDGDDDFEVVVAAHMDEIGFLVRHVHEDGFLELDPLGGWDPTVMNAQHVTVHAEDGDLPGVIGSPPPHTMDEEDREERPEVDDHYVDVGLPYEAVVDRVDVGDPVTMRGTTRRVGNCVAGKALDDRVCLYAMLRAARRVDPDVTVHFAATVQEEVGIRGARALGTDVEADLAVALDVTVANDIPQFRWEGDYVTRLGEGTAIKIKDSSVLTNPKVHRRMRAVAEREDVPYQLEVLPRGGTDTHGFQIEGGPRAVGAISVPTRYLHTATETADVGDVDATVDLLAAFLDSETGDHDYRL